MITKYTLQQRNMHAPVIWEHLREARYLDSFFYHMKYDFPISRPTFGRNIYKYIPNYVLNDQVSNLSVVWSHVH